ncbi:MAG: hypothetical protein ACI94Y_000873 [Maribacter sp.]|jgi:hypothetical protein
MKQFSLLLLILTILQLSLFAQNAPCSNFESGTTDGWTPIFSNPSLSSPGLDGTTYLRIGDASGASYVVNNSSYAGDWNQFDGQCLCYDYKVFNDAVTGSSNIYPSIQIYQGADPSSASFRAVFYPNITITENDDWVHICAPIEFISGTSTTLPSNSYGSWTMVTGSPSGWNSLLSGVNGLAFWIDVAGSSAQNEIIGVDNVCIEDCSSAEPDCVDIINENTICNPDGSITYSFDFTYNGTLPADNFIVTDMLGNTLFNVGGLSLVTGSTYSTVSFTIPAGTNVFCFRLRLFGEEECCHIEYCIDVPVCDPCDSVWVESFPLDDTDNEGDCCHSIDIVNNFNGAYFTNITSRIITPGVTFSNPVANSGWSVTGSGNSLDWTPPATPGFVPLGSNTGVMDFCLDDIVLSSQIPQTIVFDWWTVNAAGALEIVCSDTLEFDCSGCLFVSDDIIECNDDGTYNFNFNIWNNTNPAHDATDLRIVPLMSGVCLNGNGSWTPVTLPLPSSPLSSGGSDNLSLTISDCGAGLVPGSVVPFRLILLDNGVDLDWCCHVDTLWITIPECPEGCTCEDFEDDVAQGFTISGTACTKTFTPIALEDCDSVRWHIDGAIVGNTNDNNPFTYTFTNGNHFICMIVIRYADDGTICEAEYCISIDIDCPVEGCTCEDLQNDVAQGFIISGTACTKTFTPIALEDCDFVEWYIDGTVLGNSNNNTPYTHTFTNGSHYICMIVTRTAADGTICVAEYCIYIDVNCSIGNDCNCETLQDDVAIGFSIIGTTCTKVFMPIALKDCDIVEWYIDDAIVGNTNQNTPFTYTFTNGNHFICMIVTRYADDGTVCVAEYCIYIDVFCLVAPNGDPINTLPTLELYPNPVKETLYLEIPAYTGKHTNREAKVSHVEVFDINGKRMILNDSQIKGRIVSERMSMDVNSLILGAYFVRMTLDDGNVISEKFIKIK